ncbi:hypothetical protein [Massilia sp. YMA4]|uniref:hypothetical protein n=1 Tax=Massilia sp. YMA4 TaxID=1593482 RepID=UPI0015843B43|nr:hypothetical protein [Massilia sp. YMA4]
MKKYIAPIIFSLGAFQVSPDAHAVDKWSRACRFDTVPAAWKYPAVLFMRYMVKNIQIPDYSSWPTENQKQVWINESLTTDYFSVRYYLFAQSEVYTHVSGRSNWRLWKVYRSGWTAEEVLEGIRMIPDFKPFYANRGPTPWYSARAGEEGLAEVLNDNPIDRREFRTIGVHAYYDGTLKRLYDIGTSDSRDCNLSQWGQHGLFDR